MKTSKYIKVNANVLLEYIYDDGNLIGEPYEVLINIKDGTYGYMASPTSISNNRQSNQLFVIDSVSNKYGLVNPTTYSFLQTNNYSSGFPIQNDTIRLHFPINYTFGEYIGFYISVYTFDNANKITYDLSNFFFDITNTSTTGILQYSAPPLLFQEVLWGKNIDILFPSIYAVSNQLTNGSATPNSINYNLTNGIGLSLNSPVFIDFSFITTKKVINSVTTYLLTTPVTTSLPQVPEFIQLGVTIQHSLNGDYFEIFGTYNGTISGFNTFINNSIQLGNRYYVQYNITLYEQTIRGKSFTITVTSNFNETIEYRPIIKYSTTTAIIQVEMFLIDAVDNSQILRVASYGMLQDEVSKYSLSLTKINLSNANKPKVYNIKSPIGAAIFGNGVAQLNSSTNQVIIEPVIVTKTVLANAHSVVAKSDNVKVGNTVFFGMGQLMLNILPFDNIIVITIAQDVSNTQLSSNSGKTLNPVKAPKYLDMSNMGTIQMVIQNQKSSVSLDLYLQTAGSNSNYQVNLAMGVSVFLIPSSKINDIRNIYNSGNNIFYITSNQGSNTSVIYSGLFSMYDSTGNISNLNSISTQINNTLSNTPTAPTIINDPNSSQTGIAYVTRTVSNQPNKKTSFTPTNVVINSSITPIPGVIVNGGTSSVIFIKR